MVDVAPVLAKVRALGADVVLDGGKMTIVGSVHLNPTQRTWLAENRAAIEAHLRQMPGDDGAVARPWADFARILYGACPDGADPCDWSWFVTMAGKAVRGEIEAEAP